MGSRPTEVIGRQVRRWRDERKISAQTLANRLAEIGSDLDRRAVSKIETGKRGVSVDEWLQLAHVLAVPPALLLVDLQSGEDIAVAPNVHLHPWAVYRWIAGELAASPMPPDASDKELVRWGRVEEFGRAKRAVALYELEQLAVEHLVEADAEVRAAEYTGDEARLSAAKSAQVAALRELAKTLDAMVENGMVPAPTSAETTEKLRSLGLSRFPDRLTVWQPSAEGGEDGGAPE